jgi:sigma-E factor negative regulatory protein RseA
MSQQITTDQFAEQLSALMDGELPRDQLRFLLRRVDTDAELTQRWSRYQIARTALHRQQVAMPLRADFHEILMQRIAVETAPLANRRGAVLLRWAGGGAIAAAVAVVALVVSRPVTENPAVAPIAAVTAPVSAPQDWRAAQPLPLVNFDYAQPASAVSLLDMGPRYDPRHRYEAAGAGMEVGGVPYVLLTAPQVQQTAANKPQTPPQQP